MFADEASWDFGFGGGGGYGFAGSETMEIRDANIRNELSTGGSTMSWDLGGVDIGVPDVSIDVPDIIIGGGGSGGSGITNARERAVTAVNSAERTLVANLSDQKAGNMTAEDCAGRFDKIWTSLVTQLQSLGAEGERAIADRQAGGKYDWFAYYRPAGVPISASVPKTGFTGASVSTGLTGLLSGSNTNAILIFLLVGLAVWIAAKSGAFNR